MNYSLNVKSSSIVHTLLSNCVKLLGKVQRLLIKCINYSVISKRIRVVSPKFYTVRKNFTGPPVPPVPTNLKSACRGRQVECGRDNWARSKARGWALRPPRHRDIMCRHTHTHTLTYMCKKETQKQ